MQDSLRVSLIAILAASFMAFPASGATINLGGNGGLLGGGGGGVLGLGGESSGNTSATVNTDNLNDGSAQGVVRTNLLGGANDDDATATLDLGGAGKGTLLDLFGDGSGGSNDPTTANVTLGSDNGATGKATLDLFGDGSGTGLPGVNGSNVALDLFGSGGGTSGVDGAGGSGGDGGAGGNGGAEGNGGAGGAGDLFGPGTALPGTRIALAGSGNGKCFLPNDNQVQKLVTRHPYVQSTFNSWGPVSEVKLVDVGLCPTAAPEIVGNPNISRLQAYIGSHAALRAQIDKLGHAPDDVIGMDKSGGTLTVYVM